MAKKLRDIDRDGVREGSGQFAPNPQRNLFLRRLAVSRAREQRYAALYQDGQEQSRRKLTGPKSKLVKRQRIRYSLVGLLIYIPLYAFFRTAQERGWLADDWLPVWSIGIVIFCIGNIIWMMVVEHRLKYKVIDADNRICPNCGYSLLGHEAEGNCPECSDAFTPSSLEAAWREIRRCP